MSRKSSGWILVILGFIVLSLFFAVTFSKPSQAASQVTINVVTSYWEYNGTQDWVVVGAEIENNSGQFIKDVAVQSTLKDSEGTVVAVATGAAIKTHLAPGEKTFYHATVADAGVEATSSVELVAFGDPGSAQDSPYLPDPQPLYQESNVEGGTIYYYGEFKNQSAETWQAPCTYCEALSLVGAYYDNGELVAFDPIGARPQGHIAPGETLAFRFIFSRVPNGNFKLFRAARPMNEGEYATSWSVENLAWTLEESISGNEVNITATIRNESNVTAEPDIWFVGRDSSGIWIGWTFCAFFSELEPGESYDCEATLPRTYMHLGEPEDIQEVEALVASGGITDEPPEGLGQIFLPFIKKTGETEPLPTPAPTSTPTATAEPETVSVLPNHSAYASSSNTVHIVGEVQNNTTHYLDFVEVEATIFDEQGDVVGTQFTYTWLENLSPGEKTCFDILIFDLPDNWDYYEFEEVAYRIDGVPRPNITIFDDSGAYDSNTGWHEITGQVRNDESEVVESVSVTGTLYDAAGTVVGCDFAYPDDEDLNPGQTSAFELLSVGRDYADVASYQLQAEGSSLTHQQWLQSREQTD